MQSEWAAIRGRKCADLGAWAHRFEELVDEESELRDAGRWTHGRADFLGVLEQQRDELSHSRIIAWLLDPAARHGLGSRVLAGILNAFPSLPGASNLQRVRTRCEEPFADGRFDVVVKDGAVYLLVIENKVDADEGEGQCDSYSRELPGVNCILLSPYGRCSREQSSFKPMKYREFAHILREALKGGNRTSAGRSVAEDYLRTLEREFP